MVASICRRDSQLPECQPFPGLVVVLEAAPSLSRLIYIILQNTKSSSCMFFQQQSSCFGVVLGTEIADGSETGPITEAFQ